MPRYDRKCPSCGWIAINLLERMDAKRLCDDCGEPTERAWLTPPSVVGDEMDHVQVNGLKEPRRFTSKQEHARWLKANGFRINDAHVGEQGSDKSKWTSRTATMDPQTLANATALVTRAASAPATSAEDDGPRGITSNEGVIRYLERQAQMQRGEFF